MKISKYKDRWRTNIKTPDGKYKSVYGKTQKEVRLKANKLIQEIENDEWIKKNDTTYENWVKEWLEVASENYKPRTIETYKGHLNNRILPYFGKKRIQDIKPIEVQKFINELSKEIAPKTIRNVYTILSKSLSEAVKNGIINSNPASDITLPRLKHTEMLIVPENLIPELLNSLYQHTSYADSIELVFHTGLRQSELVGLTFDKYSKATRTLLIDRQLIKEKGGYSFVTPKHNVIRRIPLNDRSVEIIENRLNITKNERLNDKTFNEGNFIFFNKFGNHMSHSALIEAFKKSAKDIDMPALRFHDLRHTYATLSLKVGTDPKTLSVNLGHANASFTLNRYGHTTPETQQSSADKLGNLLGSFGK